MPGPTDDVALRWDAGDGIWNRRTEKTIPTIDYQWHALSESSKGVVEESNDSTPWSGRATQFAKETDPRTVIRVPADGFGSTLITHGELRRLIHQKNGH